MRAGGLTQATVVCLAPQNSRTSVGLYRRALENSAEDMAIDFIESWHDHPLLIAAFAEKLEAARAKFGRDVPVIFTAHSVPARTITDGDRYEQQARETGALVAQRVGLPQSRWSFAFQSQGMSGGAWIGPTVEETITKFKDEGQSRVLIQPVGFVCDHIEVLYDIDIAFREFGNRIGVEVVRAESLNDSPGFIAALADLVRSRRANRKVTKASAEATKQAQS
jgi:ferrochelatase